MQTTDTMDENKTHQRGDSQYSMDSFVADFPTQEGEKSTSPPSPGKTRPQTYFSPSSGGSVATTPASHSQTLHHQPPRNPNFQDTIEYATAYSSEATPPIPRQAPNPFFPQGYYDDSSEISDGSFIVHETPPPAAALAGVGGASKPPQQTQSGQASHPSRQKPPTAARKGDNRDRFPSFDDSVGSSGSIQYVRKAKQTPSKPAPPPVNAPLTAEQIRQLPYQERKLLAQRRAEQERQQLQSQQPPMPFTPQGMPQPSPRHDVRGMSQPRGPPQQVYGSPYMVPPPDMYFPSSPIMMQHPLHAGQPPYGGGRPAYPGVPPPPIGPPHAGYGNYPHIPPPQGMPYYPMQPPPMGGGGAGGYTMPPSSPQVVAHMGQQQPPQPNHPPASTVHPTPRSKDHLQTTGLPRGYTGGAPIGGIAVGRDRLTSSSLDSSDDKEYQGGGGGGRRKNVPPPPPPPPSGGHIRTDSSGSMSSLDRSGGNHNRDGDARTNRGKKREETNFLARLNPWAPKVPNLQDYHRKNQAFLRRASLERQRSPSPSPKQEIRKVRLGSADRPPPSRGTHQRLPSIGNDDWEEKGGSGSLNQKATNADSGGATTRIQRTYSSGEDSGYSEDGPRSQSRVPPRFKNRSEMEADERASLLPPSGISSNEQYDKSYSGRGSQRGSRPSENSDVYGSVGATVRMDNTTKGQWEAEQERDRRNRKKKKKSKGRSRRSRQPDDLSGSSYSSSSASSQDYQRWMKKRSRMLEKERSKLMKQWRAEARAEEEAARVEAENKRWYNRAGRYMESEFGNVFEATFKFLTWAEAFVANIPLTINAIALAIANLGVVWFKFAEENMQSCEPVHYHSSQCTFPEFPGCFYCDTEARMYKIAVDFHWGCSIIAGVLASLFICKLIIAPKVVFDELGSPTTAAPAGLLCMTLDIVFAGRGIVGQAVVSTASFVHLCLAVWFIYMALAYHIMPEPSWFPNTSSIGISAVKTWLYYPMAGHFLMAISLSLNFFFFPISLIRVAVNRKISATVGWMQMSAPNVSLYALTLMAQPSFEEEHPDITKFQVVHRLVYLPCMHVLFTLCILGMCASLHSLIVRWNEFRKLPFSPAHAAFCVPTLSHANAVQAYRAAVNSFSAIPHGSPFKVCLYCYWVTVLVGGTIVTLWIGIMFLFRLSEWTHIDTEGEIEPPAPYETAMTSSNLITTGETLVQPFVSPAILQANETGALVLARNQAGDQVYRRTRKVTALGFEPIMTEMQFDIERDLLLDWVARNPPRRRHRTLSVPGIDFSYGEGLGTGNTGVYGGVDQGTNWNRRQRATTSSPYSLLGRKSTTPQPRYR